jgi:uncharacterized protein YjbI with pentapeptide repeats
MLGARVGRLVGANGQNRASRWEPMKGREMRRAHRHNAPGRLRLWRIGYALAASFVITLAALGALAWAAFALLHYPRLPHQKTIAVHDAIGVAQLVFASVAGAGALVALVMAYRRQRVAEAASAHDRAGVLNVRFTATAAQLGDDKAAVRLAGVHGMAGLADDWEENRQTCIDVLCAYLRMPYEPDPGAGASVAERLTFRASREVRHTVIRLIAAHLRKDAAPSWRGFNFDFTGVAFDGGSFSDTEFSGGTVSFARAEFCGGTVQFIGAEFCGGTVDFADAKFYGGTVDFADAKFYGGTVSFVTAEFYGSMVDFADAQFCGGTVSFVTAEFSGGTVAFGHAIFSRGMVDFFDARFSGGTVDFADAEFSGDTVDFRHAEFSDGVVSFPGAKFCGGTVSFHGAKFCGGTLNLLDAKFSGDGAVDFSGAADWSHPPEFSWEGPPPFRINLPTTGREER